MITMEEFTLYSPVDQYMCLCDRGICLQGQQEGEYEVYLYGIDCFFVEVHYHSFSERFAPMRIFEKGPSLERYLADITLPNGL